MSNQNDDLDIDDQLYILLASMKEYREAIADDNKRLETFYNEVASGVLSKTEKHLKNANQKQIDTLNSSIQELSKVTQQLDWRFIAIYASAFVALVIVFFLAIFLYVPSMDEIKQRKALADRYNMEVQMCTVDGIDKPCVRIMKNQCNYGGNNDLCVIDPK